MPSLVLGIATVTFEDHYPTIDGQIEFTVPADIPEVGGKSYTLPAFSLGAKNPSTTIAVNIPQFSGSITVSLDFKHTLVDVKGSIQMVTPKPYTWPVGPGSAAYANIPPRKLPDWTATTPVVSPSMLQQALNSAPAGNRITPSPVHVDTGEVTRLALEALLLFYGMDWIKDEMQAGAAACAQSLSQSLSQSPQAAATAGPADISAGGVVLALGALFSAGAGAGVSAGFGLLITTDGDFGIYGSFSLGVGAILEISASVCISVYWGAAGLDGLNSFDGRNLVISADIDVVASLGLSIAWPCNQFWQPTSGAPCGITISVGVGVGNPVNVFVSGSNTWVGAAVPPLPPPAGNLIYQGDTTYWSVGFQLYWFSSWAAALQVDSNGNGAWSTGAGNIKSATITQSGVPLSGMPSGVLTVCGPFTGGPQLFGMMNYLDNVYLQLGADGQQPGSGIYQQAPPAGFQATTPPSISVGTGYLNVNAGLNCAFYATWEDALNWNTGGTSLPGGGPLAYGINVTRIPSGWNWLVITQGVAQATPVLITQFLSTMTGMLDLVNGQAVFYVA